MIIKFQAYKKRKIPLLTESHVKKRLNFAQYWRKARSTEFKNLPIMFSDEKKFTVDGGLNKQNLRVYAISRDEADKNGGTLINLIKLIKLIINKRTLWCIKKPSVRNGLDRFD